MFKAYNKLVTEIQTLQKDTDNPFFHSKYVDLNDLLAEVKGKIIANGFTLLQYVKDGKLVARLVWTETGEDMMVSEMDLVGATDMQKLGSAVTYARRYTLLPMLQAQCEDDDGNVATHGTKAPVFGNNTKNTQNTSVEAFVEQIQQATSEKQLGALWYKWKEVFAKESDEYKKLNKISSDKKQELKTQINDEIPY